jgi:hypothetical protein
LATPYKYRLFFSGYSPFSRKRPGFKATHMYGKSIVTHPEHSEQLGKVMSALTDFWYQMYPDKYIDKIYAHPVSDKGDIFLQKLYFAARYDVSENAFMLDLKRPGASRFIHNFQKRLEAKSQTLSVANPLKKPIE